MAHDHDPLGHVLDSPQSDNTWTLFDALFYDPVAITLPKIPIFGYELQLTKFMILELIAAVLVLIIFIPLARRVRGGALPRGPWWNAVESLLTFVRNDIAKPNLQEDTDRWVPLLWTMFVFILVCNLLGMIPLLGAPTASIFMTAGLALFSLLAFHLGAIAKMGPFRYLQSLWPTVEIVPYPGKTTPVQDLLGLFGVKWEPKAHGHGHDDHGHGHGHGHDEHPAEKPPVKWYSWPLWVVGFLFGQLISLMIFVIEFAGTFIKSGVLALRLFVNMFAGHVILASLLVLIVTTGQVAGLSLVWGTATFFSVLGMTVLSFLELFVAFLQAYVFTFLTALFLGLALHPSH
jgi:F-type H+-transporting ATPase subunit a